MPNEKFLGEFELIVMGALMRLGDAAYGVAIIEEIEHRTGRDVSVGALYSTLNRLEKKGYVEARMGEASAVRGGRAKRFFRVTRQGQTQVERSAIALHSMMQGLPAWLKGAQA
ncbi:MAG: PadR family transcriptional regulator [Henriciella sp.]